ncbi:unnamed protein product [Adineta steineri]|uniref:Uncharacterized protein n=1 Tax=Adineta steineri TaxID=433720 RepID=A0A814AJR5_9BILA|nr:unnamed protein product [Adineta steineri]CAF0916417.1 unnamed protein product [Adineta steineri]
MTLLWNSYIFLIFFPIVKLQKTDIIIDTTTIVPNKLDYDTSIMKSLHITILGALNNDEHIKILNQTSLNINNEIEFSSQSFILDPNPLLTMTTLCEVGGQSHAKIIIVGSSTNNDNNDLTLSGISYISDFYNIPIITIASRDNIFSDKALYDFIIRLVPPYLYEADAWFSIIRQLKYTKVVLIFSQEEESRMVASRFQLLTDDSDIQIERMEEYISGTNLTSLISNLTSEARLLARVYIIHAGIEDTDELLTAVVRLQQLENFVWIINERVLVSNSSALFDGILGVKLHSSFTEENLLIDATQLIMNTFSKFIHHPPLFWSEKISVLNCSSMQSWSYGRDVFQTFLNSSVEGGITGNISFNEGGDRIESLYEIINIQHGQLTVVGTYRSNTSICTTSSMCREVIDRTELKLNEDQIIWPNGLNRKPDGVHTRRNVSVVTIVEKPFIFARPGNNCDPLSEVYCTHKNLNNSNGEEYEQYCCYGYCIALLQELSKNLSFVFTLHLVADGKYGSFEKDRIDQQKRWDGMIGELINYQADMIIAPLTMSPERADDIEFTKPYKYHGITVLVRKNHSTSNLGSFLQPFKGELWIMVLLSVHIVAFVLYLLDRYSPDRLRFASRQDKKLETNSSVDSEDEEDPLNLSRALWFTWGVLLNSGIGEGTPKSFSARVLGMVWAGFTMIMVASYTANLAAFLVLDQPKTSISGINDARLRNPQDNFTYATVKGSSVDMYFKRQVEFSTMYRTMESKNYLTVDEAISDLRDEKLNAFFWDSPRLEYEAAKDCDLVTAGELFGRSSYGIALRKKDAWINPLSHAILSFHEKGFMEILDNHWIYAKHETQCADDSSSPATLGVDNMSSVFLLVIVGATVGIFFLAFEIVLKRRKERLENESEISRTALIRWKKKTEEPEQQQQPIMFESNNQEEQIANRNSYSEFRSNRHDHSTSVHLY